MSWRPTEFLNQMRAIDIAAVIAVVIMILTGSCVYGTNTSLCGNLRCPEGWSCSAEKDACIPGVCGNGNIDGNEVCDDGNAVEGDGCDTNCTPTGCGNGIRTDPEECDGDKTQPGFTCSR